MSSLRVHSDRLEIHLTPAEKALALRREDITVPRAAIRSVTITDDPWIWIRGIRAPGTLVPLVLAIGTWKFHGGKDFLIIKNKRQAVIIDITGEEYARVVVSTNHAADLIDTLNVGASQAAEVHAAKSKGAKSKPARQPRTPQRTPGTVEPVLADSASEPEANEAQALEAAQPEAVAKPARAPRKRPARPEAAPAE